MDSRTDKKFQFFQLVTLSEKNIALKWFNQSKKIYLETAEEFLFVCNSFAMFPSVRFSQWTLVSPPSSSISDHDSRWDMCSARELQPNRHTDPLGA